MSALEIPHPTTKQQIYSRLDSHKLNFENLSFDFYEPTMELSPSILKTIISTVFTEHCPLFNFLTLSISPCLDVTENKGNSMFFSIFKIKPPVQTANHKNSQKGNSLTM